MTEPEESIDRQREAMEEIGRRITRGEKVSLQDQLKYYNWRKVNLSQVLQNSSDPKKFAKIHHKLEGVENRIAEINGEIMNSGRRGGGVMGQGSIKDSRNTPR